MTQNQYIKFSTEKQWIKDVDHSFFYFVHIFPHGKNVEIHHVDKSKCGKVDKPKPHFQCLCKSCG